MKDNEIIKIGNAVPSLRKSNLSEEERKIMGRVIEKVHEQRRHKEIEERGLGHYVLKIKNELETTNLQT